MPVPQQQISRRGGIFIMSGSHCTGTAAAACFPMLGWLLLRLPAWLAGWLAGYWCCC